MGHFVAAGRADAEPARASPEAAAAAAAPAGAPASAGAATAAARTLTSCKAWHPDTSFFMHSCS